MKTDQELLEKAKQNVINAELLVERAKLQLEKSNKLLEETKRTLKIAEAFEGNQ